MQNETPIIINGQAETALQTLRLLPDLKSNAKSFADKLAEDLDSGNVLPREIEKYFVFINLVQKRLAPRLDEALLDSQGANKKIVEYGIEWEVAEFGTKYHYENCGDKIMDSLIKKQAELKSEIEARQKFLKSLTGKTIIVNEPTGEVLELYPPRKTSTTGVKKTIL